jgi:hypothetical protein
MTADWEVSQFCGKSLQITEVERSRERNVDITKTFREKSKKQTTSNELFEWNGGWVVGDRSNLTGRRWLVDSPTF